MSERFTDFNFCIITTGRNCIEWIEKCLGSIAIQEMDPGRMKVCVTDDCSDDGSAELIQKVCEARGWRYFLNTERQYALANQYRAIHEICNDDMDVVLFVDADDWLADAKVLKRLDAVYSNRDLLLTYGSFATNPVHPDMPQPRIRPYPAHVIQDRSFRAFSPVNGIYWNHLRTFRYGPFKEITPADLSYPDGRGFFHASPDTAIMTPMLELVGARHKVMGDHMLVYNTMQKEPDWRTHLPEIQECDAIIYSLPVKDLWVAEERND